MAKTVGIFAAILMTVAFLALSAYGIQAVGPWLMAHWDSRWFMPANILFVIFCLTLGPFMRRLYRPEPTPNDGS